MTQRPTKTEVRKAVATARRELATIPEFLRMESPGRYGEPPLPFEQIRDNTSRRLQTVRAAIDVITRYYDGG